MKGRYDAVLVLGLELNSDDSATPELEARLQTAAEVWRRMGADCGKIVLCGGVQPGHHTVEADVMAKWLRQAGVPVERIILERQSQDTMGNCRCAARLLGGAEGKRVLVCGMARSGIAAAKLLISLGARVTITDTKPEGEFGGALDELRTPECTFALGQSADGLIAGQDIMVISPGIAWAKPFVQNAIAQGVEVMGELELGARLTKGALVAITGTNGKTTTTTLVGELFRATGRTTHVVGNIGYPITATAGISKQDDVTVAEVSSYQCEGISQFHPHVGAVLNITEDHIVRHGSMEVYIAMKRRIFQRQTAHDVAVFNYDDATCREMAKGLKAQVAWFSRKEKVPYGAYVSEGYIVLKLGEGEQAVCRCAIVTRASRSKARLRVVTKRRDPWRSHVHRTRFRRPRSSSSADLPMCGVEGQDPSSFLSGV